jgi:hypothetical protein
MRVMWHSRVQNGSDAQAQVFALEANVACAGLALGCAYSSSDEYEAEVIQVRRGAGAYRSWRTEPLVVATAAMAAAALTAFFAV